MDKQKFDAIFPIISAAIVEMIVNKLNLVNQDAIAELYSSHLYEMLEQEETKLWQYSTEKLFDMFLNERKNGKIIFPQV